MEEQVWMSFLTILCDKFVWEGQIKIVLVTGRGVERSVRQLKNVWRCDRLRTLPRTV